MKDLLNDYVLEIHKEVKDNKWHQDQISMALAVVQERLDDFQRRIITLEDFIGQNYKSDKVEQISRLEKLELYIEHVHQNAVMPVVFEANINNIHERLDKIEFNHKSLHDAHHSRLRKLEDVVYAATQDPIPTLNNFGERINKLEGYMSMEDRVTCSDVLLALVRIEEALSHHHKVNHECLATISNKIDEWKEFLNDANN